jgi:hypothetical protein
VLYFVTPFSIAISIMGTREFRLNVVVPWQAHRKMTGNGNCESAGEGHLQAPVRSVGWADRT